MRILSILVFVLLTAPFAGAETVVLKTGTVINGKILERDTEKIKIEVSGLPLTYYVDNIQTIDGMDAAVANPNPAPAALTPPAAVETPAPVPAVAPAPAVATPPSETAPEPATVPLAPLVSSPSQNAAPAGEPSSSKRELILKFIDVFGTRESLKQNFEQLIKRSTPQQAQMIQGAFNLDELIEQLIPVYDKYFTENDLIDYINFYSSERGRKLLQTVPNLMQESIGVSLKYFKEKLPPTALPKTK
jgi:hypothetical protein